MKWLWYFNPQKSQFWWDPSNFTIVTLTLSYFFFSPQISFFPISLLPSSSLFLLHGQRFLSVSVLHFNGRAARNRGSPRLCCCHRRHAPSPSCRWKQLHQRQCRRRRRRRQHAEVLHGRRSGAEDFADGGAGDEPLLHRLRHRSPCLRQTLPLQIRRRRLIPRSSFGSVVLIHALVGLFRLFIHICNFSILFLWSQISYCALKHRSMSFLYLIMYTS